MSMPAILNRERLVNALTTHDAALVYAGLTPMSATEHLGTDPRDSLIAVTDGSRYGLSMVHEWAGSPRDQLLEVLASDGPVTQSTLITAHRMVANVAKSIHWCDDAMFMWNCYARNGDLYFYEVPENDVYDVFDRLLRGYPSWPTAA
jgi:hypothetical protein